MADDDKRKFEIPWATLLPLLAALAGVIAQFRPLVSARPGIPSEKPIEVIAVQDVDARLWQDPLAVAQKAKAQLEAETLVRDVPQKRVERHQIDALKKKVVYAATVGGEKVLLLAVMLDSGPYIEQGESRLRARQAVLEGLNESGFVPMDSEHIGFVTNPGEMSPVWRGKEPGKTIEDGAVLIPWEECKADESRRIYPEGTKRAFILWLPASSFNSRPLESFAALVRPFAEAATDNIDIKLLGPANSTGLRNMVAEARTPSEARDPARYDLLDGVEIISPLATAPDKALDAPNEDLPRIIEASVAK